MIAERTEYEVSTDATRLDVERVHRWLSEQSYWAQGRTRDEVERSLARSVSFGVYCGGEQVGFARVVTDEVTFGWLCDVFVDEEHRGRGVGKLLVEAVTAHPTLGRLRMMVLATRDAHGLYEGYGGFHAIEKPARWMVRRATASDEARHGAT